MAKETKRRINNMRIITLKNDYETILVETNAPEKVIKKAIDDRNRVRNSLFCNPSRNRKRPLRPCKGICFRQKLLCRSKTN